MRILLRVVAALALAAGSGAADVQEISETFAWQHHLEPADDCKPDALSPLSKPTAKADSASGLRACVDRDLPTYSQVAAPDLVGSPSSGTSGHSKHVSHSTYWAKADRVEPSPFEAGGIQFRSGEAVRITNVEENATAPSVMFSSVFLHNVTRGTGASEHTSPEHINLAIAFDAAEAEDCAFVKRAWGRLFLPTDPAEVDKLIAANPSGVLVAEVKAGMTPAEVEGVFGAPDRKADLGTKTIYFYPKMKITFVGGKVTDVE
jgi:hypothetical protein